MITAKGTEIEMIEGDYGIVLPIEILAEQEISTSDKFSIKIYKGINTEPLIVKEYTNLKDNIIEFKLTIEESRKLVVGRYKYDLDWYQDNNFLQNIIASGRFSVKEKAGGVNEN